MCNHKNFITFDNGRIKMFLDYDEGFSFNWCVDCGRAGIIAKEIELQSDKFQNLDHRFITLFKADWNYLYENSRQSLMQERFPDKFCSVKKQSNRKWIDESKTRPGSVKRSVFKQFGRTCNKKVPAFNINKEYSGCKPDAFARMFCVARRVLFTGDCEIEGLYEQELVGKLVTHCDDCGVLMLFDLEYPDHNIEIRPTSKFHATPKIIKS